MWKVGKEVISIFEWIADKKAKETIDRILAEDKPIAPIGYRATIELEPELYIRLITIGFEEGKDLEQAILAILRKEVLC